MSSESGTVQEYINLLSVKDRQLLELTEKYEGCLFDISGMKKDIRLLNEINLSLRQRIEERNEELKLLKQRYQVE